ncbi:MAG: transglutaminaseTgpA domain-containing protein [Eubacteriales bacterium]|nr:transglutaminaseTgpA domain-containing protein [Eubacteriales bacterium]
MYHYTEEPPAKSGASIIIGSFADMAHSSLTAFALALIVNAAFLLDIHPAAAALYSVFFTLLAFVFFGRALKYRIYMAVAAFILYPLFILSYSGGSFAEAWAKTAVFFRWARDYISGYENYHLLFVPVLSIILTAFLSFFVYFTVVRLRSFTAVLVLSCFVIGIQYIFELPEEYAGFLILLALLLIQYMRSAGGRIRDERPGKYEPAGHYALWIIPLCLLAVFAAVRLPESSRPVQWPWLDSKLNRLMGMQGATYMSEFDIAELTAGSNDEVSLGGDLELNDNVVLIVNSPRFMYLKAASRDHYTGHSWLMTDKSVLAADDPENSVLKDTLVMLEGLRESGDGLGSVSGFFFTDKITIRFANIQTKSIFAPAKINNMNFSAASEKSIFVNTNGILVSKKLNKKPFTYTLSVFTPKYSNPEFRDFLRKSGTSAYDGFESRYIADDYLSKYLQLPQTLPVRVKEMAARLTEAAENDYDKAKAIESFLSSNYAYTLKPGSVPPDKDFVDHFLFGERKGYCTYFASAMTILARCSGLPARYVEGYMLPPVSDTDKNYVVTNKLAHAWAEIYLEGYGWLPFEPTAAYNSLFYSSPAASEKDGSGYSPSTPYDEFWEELLEEDGDFEVPLPDRSRILIYILIPAGAILLLALAAMLFNNRKDSFRKWSFSRMSPGAGIAGMYSHMVKRLGFIGHPMLGHETPGEYLARIRENKLNTAASRPKPGLFITWLNSGFGRDKDEGSDDNVGEYARFISGFARTTELFEKARYGNTDIVSEHDKYEVFRIYNNMSYFESYYLGRLRYFLLHYLAGAI